VVIVVLATKERTEMASINLEKRKTSPAAATTLISSPTVRK